MHLITLNIWGGHVKSPLLDFIKQYQYIDIFCFQEVYHQAKEKISNEERFVHLNIFKEIQKLLPNHQGYFRPAVKDIYGIASFVKKTIRVLDEGGIIIHENENYIGRGPTHSRNLQWLRCLENDDEYYIANVHGLWNGLGKNDSSDRLNQAQAIKIFMDNINQPKILCGDFNLRPDTKSINIIESGLNNLISKYKISSTRTSLYPKKEKFADYIFTSSEIKVNTFTVLDNVVSDHAPLLLNFGIYSPVIPVKTGI